MNMATKQFRRLEETRAGLDRFEKEIHATGTEAFAERDFDTARKCQAACAALGAAMSALDSIKDASPRAAVWQRSGTRRSKRDYPRFHREDDELVRVGWSKSKNQEYVQRGSRQVIDSIVRGLSSIGSNGKPVTTDKLIEVTESDHIPSYQIYMCLGWLEKEGLVAKKGREGWQIREPVRLLHAMDQRWHKLQNPDAR